MLIESKSLLAKLMATENLTVEVRNVPTAFFDMQNRVLVMPALKEGLSSNLMDLFGGHEVGHALFTPMEGWHDSVADMKVNRSILNVCEDARIEKKIKRKYPGLRNSFVKAYRELMEQDFFGLRGAHPNTLNFIDRVNLHTKGGAAQGIKFSPEESSLLKMVEDAETFEETVAAAVAVQAYMKKKQEEIKLQTEKEKEFSKAEDGEGDEYDIDEDGSSDDMTDGNSGADESDEGKPANRKGTGSGDDGYNDEDVVQSHTDNNFRNKEKELFQTGLNYTHVTLPEVDLDKVIISYTDLYDDIIKQNERYSHKIDYDTLNTEYNKFRTESNKVVSYLVKEFEMRKNAEQLKRASVAKTGELNLSKIYSYGFAEDLFKRITVTPGGKSHGLVMFIDWSGSMHNNMRNTIKQLLNLVMFCRKVNIPYEVYAFSNNVGVPDAVKRYKKGNLVLKNFSLLNIISSKMNASEFTRASKFLLGMFSPKNISSYKRQSDILFYVPEVFQLSSTPLNEAIISAKPIINKFRKEYRLQIVNTVFLTDGEGHSLYNYCLTPCDSGDIRSKYLDGGTKSRVIIHDEDTKASVVIADVQREQTPALLKLLKQSTNTNVIGFYIIDSREVRRALNLYTPEGTDTQIMVDQFKKEKTLTIKSAGYDEYYLLNSSKMDVDEEVEFEVKSTSTRSLVSAFGKYTGNRVQNRTVLNKFINLIA